MALLRRVSREGRRAVLLSTHDLDLALRASDRLWLLPPGGPLRAGAPEDLALGGALGAVFDQGDVAFDPAAGEFRVHGHPRAHTPFGTAENQSSLSVVASLLLVGRDVVRVV